MTLTGTRYPLKQARELADKIASALAFGCRRVEVAGSIRRKRDDVGDIEIVAVPVGTNLFDEDVIDGPTRVDPILEGWIKAGKAKAIKRGNRYKQLLLTGSGLKLDLFLVAADVYGMALLVRTGPWQFSKAMVTPQWQGGLMPSEFRVSDGFKVLREYEHLPTPEEVDVFKLWGLDFIKPEARS